MKLKKLAAGACALALGAAMMAVPAFAVDGGDATFEDGNNTSFLVYATGKTTDKWKITVIWDDCQYTYSRTWNTTDMKFDYTEKTWENNPTGIRITNYSSTYVTYSVSPQAVAGITATADKPSGTIGDALNGTEETASINVSFTGDPGAVDPVGNNNSIKLADIGVFITVPQL